MESEAGQKTEDFDHALHSTNSDNGGIAETIDTDKTTESDTRSLLESESSANQKKWTLLRTRLATQRGRCDTACGANGDITRSAEDQRMGQACRDAIDALDKKAQEAETSNGTAAKEIDEQDRRQPTEATKSFPIVRILCLAGQVWCAEPGDEISRVPATPPPPAVNVIPLVPVPKK